MVDLAAFHPRQTSLLRKAARKLVDDPGELADVVHKGDVDQDALDRGGANVAA